MRSFSYLASGQVSQDVRDGSHTYTFAANDNGRNASASLNSSTVGSYLYNAFEQRVQKVAVFSPPSSCLIASATCWKKPMPQAPCSGNISGWTICRWRWWTIPVSRP